MKKLSFILGFAVMACLAFAQNKVEVTQLTNGNSAAVTQTGDKHQADVTQLGGNGNEATIIQNGGNHNRIGAPVVGDVGVNADVQADDLTKAKGLVQEGNENEAIITQTGNDNIIQQFRVLRGVYNSVYQKGDENSIKIDQVGDKNVIGQETWEYNGIDQTHGNKNDADILQQGNFNKLTNFYQIDDGNTAFIQQLGNSNIIESANQAKLDNVSPTNNKLTIVQKAGNSNIASLGELGDNITGDILQAGNSNTARMQLSHSRAWGDIDQLGDNNKANVFVNMSYIGNDNRGVVYQNGNGNQADENIGQSNPTLSSSSNTMDIYQFGHFNKANILAEGNSNTAYIHQEGNSNNADVDQTGGNTNTVRLKQSAAGTAFADADIDQLGSNNTIKGLGTDLWGVSFNGSKLDVEQMGDGNTLSLYQTNGAFATVKQDGSTNTVQVIQN